MRAERTKRAGARRFLTVLVTVCVVGSVGCGAKKDKDAETRLLSARGLYERGLLELSQRNLRRARTLLEQVQYEPDDRSELEPLVRLAIADATFYQDFAISYIDARALYLDFVTLYGDHPLAPYAQFQAGVCSMEQVSHASKDQSQTYQAIADLRDVERRFPASLFAGAAQGLIRSAESNLAEHEFIVGRFYLKRNAPLAAIERFQRVLERYPRYDEKERLYFYLGQALLRANNDVEARIYLDKLIQDYPDGDYRDEARKVLQQAGGTALELEGAMGGAP